MHPNTQPVHIVVTSAVRDVERLERQRGCYHTHTATTYHCRKPSEAPRLLIPCSLCFLGCLRLRLRLEALETLPVHVSSDILGDLVHGLSREGAEQQAVIKTVGDQPRLVLAPVVSHPRGSLETPALDVGLHSLDSGRNVMIRQRAVHLRLHCHAVV